MPQINIRDLPKPPRGRRRSPLHTVRSPAGPHDDATIFPGDPVDIIRSTFQLTLVIFLICCLFLVIAWAVIAAKSSSIAIMATGSLISGTALWFFFRMIFASVRIGPLGIRVIGLFRHHDVEWDDVLGFELCTANPASSAMYIAVKTRSGHLWRTSGLIVPKANGKSSQALLARLEDLRATHGATTVTWT